MDRLIKYDHVNFYFHYIKYLQMVVLLMVSTINTVYVGQYSLRHSMRYTFKHLVIYQYRLKGRKGEGCWGRERGAGDELGCWTFKTATNSNIFTTSITDTSRNHRYLKCILNKSFSFLSCTTVGQNELFITYLQFPELCYAIQKIELYSCFCLRGEMKDDIN